MPSPPSPGPVEPFSYRRRIVHVVRSYRQLIRSRSYLMTNLGYAALTFAIGGMAFWYAAGRKEEPPPELPTEDPLMGNRPTPSQIATIKYFWVVSGLVVVQDLHALQPDMQIVVAHPSWPWQDEALSLALHKPNVWIDLSGWSPKYFPPQLVQYANTLLKDRMLFGSDYPLITPERWMKDFDEAGFKDKVKPLILKENAKRLLEKDEALLVFPEGARGISKPFSKRYQLAEFGAGFMRLALEMQAPIVPVAVIGRVLSAAVVEKSTRLNNEATAELIAIDQRAKPAIAPPSRNGTNP